MKVFDSFAWIEYFKGSTKALVIRKYVEGGVPIYTPSVCLTEIKNKYLVEGKDPEKRVSFVVERSLIINIDSKIALNAADLKKNHGLHTLDALIYASAQSKKLPLVTGDGHFNKLSQVEMM
jgi:predicted nucleic acid-binding protein